MNIEHRSISMFKNVIVLNIHVMECCLTQAASSLMAVISNQKIKIKNGHLGCTKPDL